MKPGGGEIPPALIMLPCLTSKAAGDLGSRIALVITRNDKQIVGLDARGLRITSF